MRYLLLELIDYPVGDELSSVVVAGIIAVIMQANNRMYRPFSTVASGKMVVSFSLLNQCLYVVIENEDIVEFSGFYPGWITNVIDYVKGQVNG